MRADPLKGSMLFTGAACLLLGASYVFWIWGSLEGEIALWGMGAMGLGAAVLASGAFLAYKPAKLVYFLLVLLLALIVLYQLLPLYLWVTGPAIVSDDHCPHCRAWCAGGMWFGTRPFWARPCMRSCASAVCLWANDYRRGIALWGVRGP